MDKEQAVLMLLRTHVAHMVFEDNQKVSEVFEQLVTHAQLFRADPHIPALRQYLQRNGAALGIHPGEHYSAGLLRLLPDLIRDARRFAGIRAVLCEPSEEKRNRMYDAFEAVVPSSAMAKANVTPDEVNVVFDMLLSLCEQVRNANG
jgi:hypothetical protein